MSEDNMEDKNNLDSEGFFEITLRKRNLTKAMKNNAEKKNGKNTIK